MITKKWTNGPSMKYKRYQHACFYDQQSNSVVVLGGSSGMKGTGSETALKSTELWNIESKKWISLADSPTSIVLSEAVASKSGEYLGFAAGGQISKETSNKVWGLRRKDMTWWEMPQRLQRARQYHSVVNVASDEIPGC